MFPSFDWPQQRVKNQGQKTQWWDVTYYNIKVSGEVLRNCRWDKTWPQASVHLASFDGLAMLMFDRAKQGGWGLIITGLDFLLACENLHVGPIPFYNFYHHHIPESRSTFHEKPRHVIFKNGRERENSSFYPLWDMRLSVSLHAHYCLHGFRGELWNEVPQSLRPIRAIFAFLENKWRKLKVNSTKNLKLIYL